MNLPASSYKELDPHFDHLTRKVTSSQNLDQNNHNPGTKTKLYPSNPLGIIATFVFFIEAINATSLHLLKDQPLLLERIVWFIIWFPVFIAIAFFGILLRKREALFAPSDFKDESHFVTLLSRVRSLEIEQRVNEIAIEPPIEIESVLSLADELIKKDELKSAIRMGRSYLKAQEYTLARKYFKHIKQKASQNDPLYYRILSNLAFAEIALKQYDRALVNLKEAERILGDNIEIWQLAGLAVIYKQLGKTTEALNYKQRTINHSAYEQKKATLTLLYKDLETFD